MDMTAEQSRLDQKLTAPMRAIVDKHKDNILPLLKGKSGELSQAALKNDETVRTVATYCYALLPGIVRLAVKEPAFVFFVMANREKLLGEIVGRQEAAAGPVA